MSKIKLMKAELKAQAEAIRQQQKALKDAQRAGSLWDFQNPKWVSWGSTESKQRWEHHEYGSAQWGLVCESKEFRYKHVAYCLLRGTPYELIEPKVNEGNEIDMDRVKKFMETYREETLCVDQVGPAA